MNPFDLNQYKPRDPDELEAAIARIAAHEAFDWLWREGPYTRSEAYRWLASTLGKTEEECHMKQFDAATCARVVKLANEMRGEIVV